MIKKHIGSDRNRKAFARQKERRRQTEDTLRRRVREGPLGPVKLSLFSLSLLYSQKYFVIRENMRYYSDVFLEEFRRIYLEIGRRWQRCGKLEDSTDIFYLTKEEIEKGVEHDDWIKEAVRKRKEDYQRFAHLRTPQVISDDTSVESLLKVTLEWRQELEGQVASPGHVRAPARVVSTSEDMIAFKEGEILVTQYADPSWTPILSMAGGLVLEVGGFLSHGSIVAREYGIPAVINVTHATEIIKTGDMLVLDSFRGSVRIESAQ